MMKKYIKMGLLLVSSILILSGCGFNSPILEKKINNDDFSNLEVLLKKGENPNTTNHNGYSLLYEAAYTGNLNVAKLLVKYGADLNLAADSDSCSRTPLIEALKYRHLKVALFLAQKGTDLTRQDSCFDRTPLHWFAYYGFHHSDYDTAKKLLHLMKKKGVDFNQEDENGETPLDLALDTYTTQNMYDIVELLLQNGADGTKKTSGADPAIISALVLKVDPKVILSFIHNGIKVKKQGDSLCSQGSCVSIDDDCEADNVSPDQVIDFMMLLFPKYAQNIYNFYEGNTHALDTIDIKTKKDMAGSVKKNICIFLSYNKERFRIFPKRFYVKLGKLNKIHPNKGLEFLKHLHQKGMIEFDLRDFKTYPKLIALDKSTQTLFRREQCREYSNNNKELEKILKSYKKDINKVNFLIQDCKFDVNKHYKFLRYKKHKNLNFLQYVYFSIKNNWNVSEPYSIPMDKLKFSRKNWNVLLSMAYYMNDDNLWDYIIDKKLTKFKTKEEFLKFIYSTFSHCLPRLREWQISNIWSGKLNQNLQPYGKGSIILRYALGGDYLAHYAQINIELQIKNNKRICKGKVKAFDLKQIAILFGIRETNLYRTKYKYFKNRYELKKIIDRTNKIVAHNEKIRREMEEESDAEYKKRNKVNCSVMYNQCISSCNKKSSKGFFNDRDSCRNACRAGKNSCKNGNYSLGKITSCRGICKGVSDSDGSWLGWGTSSFDKCVYNCTDRIGK